MSTPISQQLVRDGFIRANAGTLGANWTGLTDSVDTSIIGITSNAAVVQTTGGNAASFYSVGSYTPNQYAECIASGASGGNTHGGGPTVRNSSTGYYRFYFNLVLGAACLALTKLFGPAGGTFWMNQLSTLSAES